MLIRINNIFQSISGEVNPWGQGQRCTFIRFQGCNIRCHYCDTKQSWEVTGGTEMSVPEIMNRVMQYGNKIVCITGGEPLIQIHPLLDLLAKLNLGSYKVYIETNGTYDVRELPKWVSKIADYKMPERLTYDIRESFLSLTENDYVKFVVGDITSFEHCLEVQRDFQSNGCMAQFAYSTIMGKNAVLSPVKLLNLMEENNVNGILNVQIHKLIKVQ